ncbi:MAG TPA: Mpo1-like protein [Urbifossiella sp.]|nr:Mpo1-like protein [Urbifossiella sp.]
MSYRFPLARKLLAFADRARRNWLLRHQNGFNFAIHMVGIPLAFSGVPLLFLADWYWGVAAIAGGYLLQWVGHRVEGNDVGELIPLKRALGFPVVAVAPQYAAAAERPADAT